MTEQKFNMKELYNELAKLYEISDHGKEFLTPRIRNQIITRVKEALPELAKEVGYVRLADVIFYGVRPMAGEMNKVTLRRRM